MYLFVVRDPPISSRRLFFEPLNYSISLSDLQVSSLDLVNLLFCAEFFVT